MSEIEDLSKDVFNRKQRLPVAAALLRTDEMVGEDWVEAHSGVGSTQVHRELQFLAEVEAAHRFDLRPQSGVFYQRRAESSFWHWASDLLDLATRRAENKPQ